MSNPPVISGQAARVQSILSNTEARFEVADTEQSVRLLHKRIYSKRGRYDQTSAS
jgi:sensor domain CHASE-containing protein